MTVWNTNEVVADEKAVANTTAHCIPSNRINSKVPLVIEPKKDEL